MSSQPLQKKWLLVGDIGWDIYKRGNEEIKFSGGISLNHIMHLHKLGQTDLTFLGPLSQSREDYPLENILKEREVKILSLQREEGFAPKQFIKIEAGGEKNFIRYEAGILESYTYSRPKENFDFILLPIFCQNWSWAQNLLKNSPKGKLICDLLDGRDFDQNLKFLEAYKDTIDLLVIGCPEEDDQFYQTLQEGAGSWSRRQLVTRGRLEGFYYDGSSCIYFLPSPIPKGEVVDSTGAGDAFLASFLFHLSQGLEAEDALARASSYAGEVIKKIGPN